MTHSPAVGCTQAVQLHIGQRGRGGSAAAYGARAGVQPLVTRARAPEDAYALAGCSRRRHLLCKQRSGDGASVSVCALMRDCACAHVRLCVGCTHGHAAGTHALMYALLFARVIVHEVLRCFDGAVKHTCRYTAVPRMQRQ